MLHDVLNVQWVVGDHPIQLELVESHVKESHVAGQELSRRDSQRLVVTTHVIG